MKKVLFAFIFSLLIFSAFSADWTLGVMEFSFKQTKSRSQSDTQAAQVLPQLIIEQFSSSGVRTLPQKEQLDRKLNELQTARLSLFLQLSKEYKTRDSLVLKEIKPKKLKKAIEEEMEKIRDIESQIDENLEEVQKAIEEASPKIEREEKIAGRKTESKTGNGDNGENQSEDEKSRRFPFRLPFPFFHRDEEENIVTENVVLYKNDSTALFKPSEKSLEAGFTSWDFENEVVNAKINGLITGEISTYGDYCSVTVSLRIYPGAKILGTVTEVGLLSDLMPLASSIARNLDSKIANALPVMLEFDIEPHEIAKDAKITIDDVVFSLTKTDGSFENKVIKESGIHRVKIEAPEYEDLTFSYSFTDDNRFYVHANLVPKVSGLAAIKLKKYQDGVFHTYGLNQAKITQENPTAKIQVNSKSVLGVFTIPKKSEEDSDSSNIAFFQIPANTAFDGAELIVNARPFDREANIDKRRRWMYTAYTALILSLPFTFYFKGEFTAENTAYAQGRGDYDRLTGLQTKSNICAGISATFGAWTVFELVRYLIAADKVLPAKAKIDKKAMKEASKALEQQETEIKIEDDGEKIISAEELDL
ncbi:MAG: hypothetical protein IJ630_01235 [Treponema sp.]|nr:hypothetical protein [Treponema sp.]